MVRRRILIWTAAALLLTALSPARAIELRVSFPGRTLALADLHADDWRGMSLPEKRLLIPHLIEYGATLLSPSERRNWLSVWSTESDEFLRAANGIAAIYFQTSDPAERQSRLIRLRAALPGPVTRALVEYHLALEKQRSGATVGAVSFTSICSFAEQAASCRLARLLLASEKIEAAGPDSASLRSLLQLGQPYLAREALRPPFFDDVAAPLPDRLFHIGLPLEAALLAERMTHNESGVVVDHLRSRIPLYLAGAGDFDSALRYSRRLNEQPGPEAMAAWLDWLTLAGRYREALNLVAQAGPARLASSRLAAQSDYWTGFRYSAEGLRLRSAMLLYLAGDVKKAAEGLELLKEMSGDFHGEPARYFARLRLAQILLRENPELAQKIAEDISYVAQENSWPVLEYHATILDGWAHLKCGRPYKSVINFIKARGILPTNRADHGAEYSRLLGLLASRNALAPRSNNSSLIQEINALLERRPYNEAIYAIRDWSPVESAPDYFLREAVRNMTVRGARWDALNLLLDHSRRREAFFEPGKNPGGIRGFQSSVLWTAEEGRFAYVDARRFRLSAGALAAARRGAIGPERPVLGPRNFLRNGVYVFSFPVAGGQYVFLVRGAARGGEIDVQFLKSEEAVQLSSACMPGRTEGCQLGAEMLGGLRRAVPSGRPIYAQYNPEFNIDWRSALAGAQGPALVRFYRATPGSAWKLRSQNRYRSDACPATTGLNAIPQPGFEASFSGALAAPAATWIWPELLDERLGSDGQERPVYLRRFLCGRERLRLWDLDRFFASTDLDLVIYRRRSGEAALDRAFARPFAEQGAALLEIGGSSGDRALIEAILSSDEPLSSYQQSAAESTLTLILPALP